MKNLKINRLLKLVQKILFPWKNLSKKTRKKLLIGSIATILILAPIAVYTLTHLQKSEAAWFDANWGFRQNVAITNTGTNQTDYQIAITLDTATLITANKMRSDCNDIRITDINGKLLPYWIETGANACNTATTAIWTKVPSIPTSGQTIYLYYGNPSATNVQNGNKVFEFFDDFSGSSIDGSKWTTGTIGSTSGTDWSVSGGNLIGGNTNRYIQSIKSFTGDYEVKSRNYTTTTAVNGFSVAGFWASTSNSFGILDHNGTSYYRNDAGWVNFAYNGTSQWNRNSAKVVGTTATYARTGETSGSATATGITNSGISAENIRLGARYDSSATNQNFAATWDWVLVRKTAATEPAVGSPTNEEVGAAPIAYWKFDEGTGTTAHDSSSNGNNGTLTNTPTWQTNDQCISGKCLYFDGTSNSYVDAGNNWNFATTDSFTVSAWFKTTSLASEETIILKGQNASCFNYAYLIQTNGAINFGNTPGEDTIIPAGKVSANTWYHFEAVYVNGSVIGYLNGIPYSTASRSTSTCTSSIKIGSAGGARMFKGFIDDVKIYRYARSVSQIKADFASRGGNASGVVLGASSANQNLSNGLTLYWKMDEATWSGTLNEVVDSSGNGNNGTAQGATGGKAYPTAGKFGNGEFSDGIDDYISTSSLNWTPTAFSVAYWINPTSLTNYNNGIAAANAWGAFDMHTTSGGAMYAGTDLTNRLTPTELPNGTMTTNQWQHFVFTFANNRGCVYKNGTLLACKSGMGNPVAWTGFQAGGTGSNVDINGKTDEIRIYNRALSPAEVQQLYNYAPAPVAYWNFEEGQGGSVNDISGNGNTATWGGTGNHWTQGKYGRAGYFNGTNDYVRSTHSILNNSGAATISFWMNIPVQATNYRRMLSDSSTNGITLYFTGTGTNGLYGNFGNATAGWIMSAPDLTVGGWHYITITASADDGKVNSYLDGKFIYSRAASFTTLNLQDLYMGSNVGSNYFMKGAMDDVKIYNYVRTQGQIVQDMNASHPLGGSPVGSQVGYWKFDEGYGLTNYNSGSGGHTYDGTITSATFNNDGKFGKAMSFDGTTGKYVTIPAISSLSTGNPFTISVWVRPGSTGTYRTIVGYDGTHRLLIASTGQMLSQQSGNFYSNSAGDVPDNSWTYVTYTFDGTQEKWYINGKQSGASHALTTAAWSSAFKVGQYDNVNYPYKGLIDELKIYSSALTASEIQLDYNHGATQVLGSMSDTSGLTGGQIASNSASAAYCIPGDTSTCSSPVGEWNFEEGQGITTNDTSGNGNTGTLNANTAWKTGYVGKGLSFDGSGDYVSTSNTTSTQVTSGTMEAWIKTSNAGSSYRGIVVKQNAYGIFLKDNIFIIYDWGGGGDRTTSVNLADNKWHHVVVTFQSGTTNGTILYIDGVAKLTTTMTIVNQNQSMSFGTGNSTANGQDFNGLMDQVRLFNYTRTPAQVAWDYNRGAPASYWKMDECQGTTLNDSSGNGASATLNIGASGTQTSPGTCSTAGTAWGNGAIGKYNSSLNFDGTDDYVDAGTNSIFNIINSITVSGWIKTTNTSAQEIVARGLTGASDHTYALYSDANGHAVFSVANGYSFGTGDIVTGTKVINDGNWHFVLGRFTGTSLEVYTDGLLDASKNKSTTPTSNTSLKVLIGNIPGYSLYFKGQIDDVRIYNYALTSDQIQQVFNQGAGIRFGPLQGSP